MEIMKIHAAPIAKHGEIGTWPWLWYFRQFRGLYKSLFLLLSFYRKQECFTFCSMATVYV